MEMWSSSFFFLFIQVIILLSCFNLQCLDLLGLATAGLIVRGNETDQQALLQFKAKITGDQLGIMSSWNSSSHFCSWPGVTCSRKHQRVTKLELGSLKLSGSLSPYIGNMSFLRELKLEDNNFFNHIPQEVGRLSRLETLALANNSFNGEIPSNFSVYSKLTVVDMMSNQLTGEIPALLGFLTNLRFLRFRKNNLRGTVPASLGNLSSLEELDLAENRLTGTIPEALGRLKNLSLFRVAINAISGNVPVSLFNLSNIRFFSVGINKNIHGTLPSDLAITMPHMGFFSVEQNQISGQIPTSISNASNLIVLQFQDNRLSGNVPSLEKLYKLTLLQLGGNHLGQGREGDLKFLCTLVNNTKLKFLYVNDNNFGGLFPRCISNFSTTLLHLRMEQNRISGRIPNEIVNLFNLEVISVYQNQLSGPIPFEIGRLKLYMFVAHRNFLSGTIPHSLGNLTLLTKLALDVNNIQGSIPSSIGKCQNLNGMDLSYNNLSGPIPRELFELSSLSIELDLSSNYLTGELPAEVEKLKNLAQFYVSQNRLSGLIPSSLESCVSLEVLFLNGNLFEGHIPSSLSSLRGLKALDVSDNNLSGEVPEFLTSFRGLKYLNLSFNDFEGVIPSEGVFENASATFVEGNNKLCGGIPELHLSRCNSKTSSNTSFRLKIVIIVVILLVTLAFSVVLIMWFRKKKGQQQATTWAENSLLKLSYQSILRATNRFSVQNLVGSGSFGSVYKGILEESGEAIAVKLLNLLNRGGSKSFLVECEALKNIRHRNLVKLLTAISGVDYQGNDFKALVYEFMPNGSLEDWIHQSVRMNEPDTTRNLNFFQRVSVAIDVAQALEYLHHGCETSIIHCDIKPSNILLDEEMVGHLSDFGLAKILSADMLNHSSNLSSSLGLRGTIGYAPPEYGMGGKLSTKGDVYSYGILLLEMFTGKRPTHEMFKEGFSIHNFVAAALPDRLTKIIDPILLQERAIQGTPADITLSDRHFEHLNSIFEIGLTCSAESPSERMNMNDVVSKLCFIRDKLLRPTSLGRESQTSDATKSTGT